MKECRKCGESKPLSEFALRHGKPNARCKDCVNSYQRERYEIMKDSRRETARNYYHADYEFNSTRARNRMLWSFYKLTPEAYDAMFEAQDGLCDSCGEPDPMGENLRVDHDHSCCPGVKSCGKCVRRLLCNPCNLGIGIFKDDPDRLLAAAAYLIRTRSEAPKKETTS
jgi:hypothetical protein